MRCYELWREEGSLQTTNILIYFHIFTILCFLSVQGPHQKQLRTQVLNVLIYVPVAI